MTWSVVIFSEKGLVVKIKRLVPDIKIALYVTLNLIIQLTLKIKQ